LLHFTSLLKHFKGVKSIAQAVSNVIDRDNREENHYARENCQPGVADKVFLGCAEQVAPAWGGRLDAKPEKTQA